MADALKKIRTRAKEIRKKHPSMQWKNAIKQASRDYNSGKLGRATTRQAAPSISGLRKKRVHRKVKTRATEHGLTISAAKHFIKKELEDKIGALYVRHMNATRKPMKRKIMKEISKLKSELRKLS